MVIGIAGGVGSGKSTVLALLKKEYGAYICMADALGHEAMKKGTGVHREIIEKFGAGVQNGDGEIDREVLARIVYGDAAGLTRLNGIIHPFVKEEIRRQIAENGSERLFVLETALLFETGCDELCDEVWGVITEDEIRICRLMESRGYSRERAESIMKNQSTNKELAERCDRLIVNDGDREELVRQIHSYMENVVENHI